MIKNCPKCNKPIKGVDSTVTGDGRVLYPVWSCDCGVNPANHQEREIDNKEYSENKEKEILENIIHSANFPTRAYEFIHSKEFDESKLLPVVKDYIKNKNNCGLCIAGNVGIGKTVSMIYLLTYLLNNRDKGKMIPAPVYIEYNELSILYKLYERGFNNKDDEKKKYLYYRNITNTLFIDDITSGWDMFDLINYRYNKKLITFLSSNLDVEKFKNSLGEASISRIKQDMIVDFVKADDMRGK